MKDKDQIQELFSKQLGNHEANVRPDLWNGIASQITTGATVTAGVSVLTKIIISTISVAAISTAVFLYSSSDKNDEKSSIISKNDKKSINLEENNQVLVENESINSVSEKSISEEKFEKIPAVIESPSNSSEKVNITKSLETNSIEINNDNSTSQKGVLKERDDNEQVSITNNDIVINETISTESETDEVIDQTEFPISMDKEQLVEGYSISKMPDIFTPNNDGQNDYLFVESNGISNFSIVVMNENSDIVYKSTDENFKWNGLDLFGNPVPNGSYLYFVTGTDRNSNSVKKYQSLTIVR